MGGPDNRVKWIVIGVVTGFVLAMWPATMMCSGSQGVAAADVAAALSAASTCRQIEKEADERERKREQMHDESERKHLMAAEESQRLLDGLSASIKTLADKVSEIQKLDNAHAREASASLHSVAFLVQAAKNIDALPLADVARAVTRIDKEVHDINNTLHASVSTPPTAMTSAATSPRPDKVRFDRSTLAPLWQHLRKDVFKHWQSADIGSLYLDCSPGLDRGDLLAGFEEHALPADMKSAGRDTADRWVHFSSVEGAWLSELRTRWQALPPGAMYIQRVATDAQYDEGVQYLMYAVQCHGSGMRAEVSWKWSCEEFEELEKHVEQEHAEFLRAGIWAISFVPGFVILEKDSTPRQIDQFLLHKSTFQKTALTINPVTDKVNWAHNYQYQYDRYLTPMRNKYTGTILEMGLGCMMPYGPGASHQLWRTFLPQMHINFLEYDEPCAKGYVAEWLNKTGLHAKVWIGDQSSKDLAHDIIADSAQRRDQIDIMIDDAGHDTLKMEKSLYNLWPALAAGGLYLIEDMYDFTSVSVKSPFENQKEGALSAVHTWARAVVLPTASSAGAPGRDVDMIDCQLNLCVMRKRR